MVCQFVIYTDIVIKLLASKCLVEMSKNVTFRPFKVKPARDLETAGIQFAASYSCPRSE